jgi:hypothetical protein
LGQRKRGSAVGGEAASVNACLGGEIAGKYQKVAGRGKEAARRGTGVDKEAKEYPVLVG